MNRKIFLALSMACLGLVVFVFYSNCGTPLQGTQSSPFQTTAEREKVLSQIHSGSLPPDFCQLSSSYGCQHRIFSPDLQNTQTQKTFECLKEQSGHEICPSGLELTYNTRSATDHCHDCRESYDYDEYDCHLNLPDLDHLSTLSFSASSLEESLTQTQQACLRILSGETQ